MMPSKGSGSQDSYPVERILSIPVLLSYTGTMNSDFYQYITSFIVTGSIWNTCYLEYSHTLLVSASFTGFTYYLLVYLDNQSTLIPQSHMYRKRSTEPETPLHWRRDF